MSFSTYSGLKASIADYLARSDLTLAIPDFITLAEAKFNRDLRCIQMETRATTDVNLSNTEPEFITLPLDFQTMRRVRVSSVTGKPRLEFKSGAQADEYRASMGNVTGLPQFFTIFGTEMELIPTPDQAYTLEMVYRAKLTPLSDTDTSNWLLAAAPDAYLYGALLEAAPYLQNDERIAVWGAGRAAAVDALNGLSQEQAFGSGPLQMRTTGVNP